MGGQSVAHAASDPTRQTVSLGISLPLGLREPQSFLFACGLSFGWLFKLEIGSFPFVFQPDGLSFGADVQRLTVGSGVQDEVRLK